MNILITGISGFVGSHLVEYILSQNTENYIFGTIQPRSRLDNISHLQSRIKLYDCNILDTVSVMQVVKEVKPGIIFHLAAQSYVPTSWKSPQDTIQTNMIGTVNVLEAIREYCRECVLQIAGTSEEYGQVYPDEIPIRECNPLRPLSPYGVSKVAADLIGVQYNKSYGLKVIVTRAFNHEGPRRGENFVTSSFARQLVNIENKKSNILRVGNLESIRDFTDVRDVVRAYWLLVHVGEYGRAYNICSEEGTTIKGLLDLFIKYSYAKKYDIIQDASRMRPSDVPVLIGDCSDIKRLGWKKEISLFDTVSDILDYWRKREKNAT